jgi:tetratricopeptide (TPR) repeat protein
MSVREAPRPVARADWGIALALCLLVAAVYAPVRGFPFVVYDDGEFVLENPPVAAGLTGAGLAWAFTRAHSGNYVPLAWLSHMLDVELFGLDAGAHHVANALLHAVATALLFAALRAASDARWPSAFVAALFAVHPAHVESVAWISERRDTLSAVFWMLALLAWTRYARRPARGNFALAALCLGLGLLAKPMLVTLPLVLLLLDRWPLRRPEAWPALLREKVPLFALAALGSAAALVAQREGSAVASLVQVPLAARVENALVAAARYLGVAFWPADLAVFYPLELEHPAWRVVGAALLLGAASAGAFAARRRAPYLPVGWLWYGITLLPVLGLVQVGSQGMADRYTYLPFVGLGIATAWGAAGLAARGPRLRAACAAAGIALVAIWSLLARAQLDTWRDSVALFENALAVSGEHPVVHLNLGEAHEAAGRLDLARRHYESGLALAPGAAQIHVRLGDLLSRTGERAAAAAQMAAGASAFYGAGRRSEAIALAERARDLAFGGGDPALGERLAREVAAWRSAEREER